MPLKSNKQPASVPASKTKQDDRAKFVNANLTDSEKVACKQWLTSLEELDNALLKFTEEGYRISIKYDDYSSAYAAFASPVDAKSPNAGFLLAGRGSTPLKAVKQALYAHYAKFDGMWSEHYARSNQDEFDD